MAYDGIKYLIFPNSGDTCRSNLSHVFLRDFEESHEDDRRPQSRHQGPSSAAIKLTSLALGDTGTVIAAHVDIIRQAWTLVKLMNKN